MNSGYIVGEAAAQGAAGRACARARLRNEKQRINRPIAGARTITHHPQTLRAHFLVKSIGCWLCHGLVGFLFFFGGVWWWCAACVVAVIWGCCGVENVGCATVFGLARDCMKACRLLAA